MVLGSRRHAPLINQVTVKAEDFKIPPRECEKLLGCQLHQNLEWKAHFRDGKASLLCQLTSKINGLRKVSINASFKTKLLIANGVVMSKLTYIVGWS